MVWTLKGVSRDFWAFPAFSSLCRRLRATRVSPKPPERRGLGGFHGLDPGSQEKEWWWGQSGANPSLAGFPVKQGKYREFSKIVSKSRQLHRVKG